MKNINYDLVKLLHSTLDIVWRLENHYIKDAEKAQNPCLADLNQMLEQERQHADMLAKHIRDSCIEGKFD